MLPLKEFTRDCEVLKAIHDLDTVCVVGTTHIIEKEKLTVVVTSQFSPTEPTADTYLGILHLFVQLRRYDPNFWANLKIAMIIGFFASAANVSPAQSKVICDLEKDFGVTMKRNTNLPDLIKKGSPYKTITLELSRLATSKKYTKSILIPKSDPWLIPAGAYGEGCGPT